MPTTVTVKRTVTEDDLREYCGLVAELAELAKDETITRFDEVAKNLDKKRKEIAQVVAMRKALRLKAGPYEARLEEDGQQGVKWAKEFEALAGDVRAQELRDSQPPRYKLIVEGP